LEIEGEAQNQAFFFWGGGRGEDMGTKSKENNVPKIMRFIETVHGRYYTVIYKLLYS
jgi:hypothetical protein